MSSPPRTGESNRQDSGIREARPRCAVSCAVRGEQKAAEAKSLRLPFGFGHALLARCLELALPCFRRNHDEKTDQLPDEPYDRFHQFNRQLLPFRMRAVLSSDAGLLGHLPKMRCNHV